MSAQTYKKEKSEYHRNNVGTSNTQTETKQQQLLTANSSHASQADGWLAELKHYKRGRRKVKSNGHSLSHTSGPTLKQ